MCKQSLSCIQLQKNTFFGGRSWFNESIVPHQKQVSRAKFTSAMAMAYFHSVQHLLRKGTTIKDLSPPTFGCLEWDQNGHICKRGDGNIKLSRSRVGTSLSMLCQSAMSSEFVETLGEVARSYNYDSHSLFRWKAAQYISGSRKLFLTILMRQLFTN